MSFPDEPIFGLGQSSNVDQATGHDDIAERIRLLCASQDYGVLCTQGRGQPYGSLMAYAVSNDLKLGVFATQTQTRKYSLLSKCQNVALFIDSRSEHPTDLMKVEAVTATGKSHLVSDKESFKFFRNLLVQRHPYLKGFIQAESCALFKIDFVRFFHVARFQEVHQWIP